MEAKRADELNDRYIYISSQAEIEEIFSYLGLSIADYEPGSLLILMGDGDYEEVWYSEYQVMLRTETVYRIL